MSRSRFGLAVLPVGGDRPWLALQDTPPAYIADIDGETGQLVLNTSALEARTERLYIALYTARAAGTLRDLAPASWHVPMGQLPLSADTLGVSALCVAELYRRHGRFKLRLRCDGVTDGIEEMGRRYGLNVRDESPPVVHAPAGARPGPAAPQPGSQSGSGFVIGRDLAITNAHVIDGARDIQVFCDGRHGSAQVLLSDTSNDLALIQLPEGMAQGPLQLRREHGPRLGETVVTLGFPLSGLLGSGPQIGNGVVSGLLGPGDDSRLFQLTTPIQPGSSGGPVFDSAGLLIGVITASLSGGQNVNFALRASLVHNLLEACGHEVPSDQRHDTLLLTELAARYRAALVRFACNM